MNETAGYRPLYRQVRDILVRRIAEGVWRAGDALPSEHALARDLGVSQGTVRKVLDALTAEKLLERRQGKGTFIAENTQERALFRFFRLARADGERVQPAPGPCAVSVRASRAAERQKLGLEGRDRVVEIRRLRLIDGEPAVSERITLPAALFPGIERCEPLPNTLYSLYQARYGVTVTGAEEELSAVAASAEDAAALGVAEGDPLLLIDRVARSLQDLRVEWRVSRVRCGRLVYAVSLA